MDAAAPIIEHVEVCADATRVGSALEGSMQLFMARGVSVHVSFARVGRGIEGHVDLTLPDASTETRTFSNTSRACLPLVRALGAWLSVRLDEWSETEKSRPAKVEGAPAAAVPKEAPVPVHPDVIEAMPISSGFDAPFDVDRDGKRIADPHGPEIAVSSILVSNLARHTLVGASAAATLAMSDVFMMRGQIYALTAAVATTGAIGHRLEGCRRIPGRYARSRGLALDLCVGAEVGLLERKVYGAFGPALTIHGDLTRALSLDLGGGVALPFGETVRQDEAGGIVVAVRGDVGMSWRLP